VSLIVHKKHNLIGFGSSGTKEGKQKSTKNNDPA
jgi:hypothetical protein